MTLRADVLTISFVVDIWPDLNLRSVLHENGADWAFSHVKKIFIESNLVVGNVECCLIDDTCPAELKVQPMAVEATLATGLLRLGIAVLNLANNHLRDCNAGRLAMAA